MRISITCFIKARDYVITTPVRNQVIASLYEKEYTIFCDYMITTPAPPR